MDHPFLLWEIYVFGIYFHSRLIDDLGAVLEIVSRPLQAPSLED